MKLGTNNMPQEHTPYFYIFNNLSLILITWRPCELMKWKRR